MCYYDRWMRTKISKGKYKNKTHAEKIRITGKRRREFRPHLKAIIYNEFKDFLDSRQIRRAKIVDEETINCLTYNTNQESITTESPTIHEDRKTTKERITLRGILSIIHRYLAERDDRSQEKWSAAHLYLVKGKRIGEIAKALRVTRQTARHYLHDAFDAIHNVMMDTSRQLHGSIDQERERQCRISVVNWLFRKPSKTARRNSGLALVDYWNTFYR